MRSVALSLVVLFSASGCAPWAPLVLEAPPDRSDDAVPEPTTEREVIVSYDGSTEPTPDVVVAPPTSPRGFYPPEPVLFRIGAGYGALGQIDFAPCHDQGLGTGYMHMRVTFRHSGHVVRASVERPAPPPPEALQCIADQLQLAMVPVFDGDDVTLSRSYFVN
jgi:hypothetical protein